jgi:hypothetical protein
LSNAQKNEFYQVIVNNAGANVETAALSGTVTVAAASVDVVGTSTSFTSEVNIGDILKINGEQVKVASIANNSALTLTGPHSLGQLQTHTQKFLQQVSQSHLTKLVEQEHHEQLQFLLQVQLLLTSKKMQTFTGEVVTTMDRANAKRKAQNACFSGNSKCQSKHTS